MRRNVWRAALPAVLAILFAGCGDDIVEPDRLPAFVIEVSGERFTVEVVDPAAAAKFDAALAAGGEVTINGKLVAGDAAFNQPWSWHLDPEDVEVVDFAIEICDGRPSMIEADLDYWLNTVGRFCPWSAKVLPLP